MGNFIFCASENKDPKCNEMNVDVFSKHKGSSPVAMFVTVHCECLKQIFNKTLILSINFFILNEVETEERVLTFGHCKLTSINDTFIPCLVAAGSRSRVLAAHVPRLCNHRQSAA